MKRKKIRQNDETAIAADLKRKGSRSRVALWLAPALAWRRARTAATASKEKC